MKALCADVDKVETQSRWRLLQKAGSAGAGAAPPGLPAAAVLFSTTLHGVYGEKK